ncbi:MAG: hypothetical protein LQ338_002564 [Usnochroma carphineum]|nr:MAG: hypothetical protein LQ338_002564 [Usnochroma carphineum]
MERNAATAYLVGDEPLQPLPHLWTCLTKHAQDNGDYPAVESFDQQASTAIAEQDILWTYADLVSKVDDCAARLYHLGVRRGHAIASFLDNRAEWALLFWVSVRLDAVFVPLNPRMIQSTAEVNHAMRVTKPGVVVTLSKQDAEHLEGTAADTVAKVAIWITLPQGGTGTLEIWKHTIISPPDPDAEQQLVSFDQINTTTVPPPSNQLDEDVCVIFTSGTSSLPKASVSCYRNLISSAIAFNTFRHLDPKGVFVQHIPVFHAWSVCCSLAFWLSGGLVVYPSRAFDARATLSAIESARCTHMLAVPSMIQSMAAHPALRKSRLDSLKMVDLAGTMILPGIVQLCMDSLRVPNAAATYGMTEGSCIVAFDDYAVPYKRHSIPIIMPCGTPMPGARVRVCEPGSRKVVKRDEIGELHIGGLQVTSRYRERESIEFYKEDGINWLVTGDQAKIDEGGLVYILGRYKDLIIRGGENISPAAIERCLDSIAGIEDSQVVGIPDEIAGEVPVAVLRKTAELALSNFDMQQKIAEERGKMYSPQSILDLHDDLNLKDYPRTLSGKVMKRELQHLVEVHLCRKEKETNGQSNASTVDNLICFWAQVTGRKAKDISPDECANTFADSITMMQFCNLVSRSLRKTIAVEDLAGDVNISRQAEVIDARPMKEEAPEQSERRGPPRTRDMIHVHGDDIAAESTQSRVEAMLSPFDLDWDDVEDIFPTNDNEALMTRRFHLRSSDRRHAYHAPNTSVKILRWAIGECLEVHSILRAMIVDYGEELPLYVVFRPNERWVNLAVLEGFEVDNPEDLSTLHLDDDEVDYAICPGPLFKVLVVHIRNTNSSGFVYVGHHSAFDAVSLSLFHEDLSTALRIRQTPKPRAAFETFGRMKYLCHDSPNASAALAYHISRLKGWTKRRSALWPPQRASQFFRGRTSQWTHIDGTPGQPHERRTLDAHPCGLSGINRSIILSGLPVLRSAHNITAPTIFLAALALLNVHRTSSSQAFFGQPLASRVWPAKNGDPDPSLPNPMDIAGPTWEVVINRIHVCPSQPLLSFLQDLDAEQKLLAHHAPVTPFKKLEGLLREGGDNPTENEHELYDSVLRRQWFNWLPSVRVTDSRIEEVQSMSRTDVGLQWIFEHVADQEVKLIVRWDDCQMFTQEVQEAVEELMEVAEWIVEAISTKGKEGQVPLGSCPLFREERGCEHVETDESGWAVQ